MPNTAEPALIGTVEALRRIAACRDDAAWSAILLHHGPAILRMAERLGGRALADDACQETLLQIRDHASQFSPPPGARDAEAAARGWIMCIAYRTALGMLRLDQRRDSNELHAGLHRERLAAAPDDTLLLKEQLELLRREVAGLPEVLRGAVCLHFYGELSYSDVSQTLACSEEVARKRVERGVNELRARLAAAGVAVGLPALAVALAGASTASAAAAGTSAALALKQFGAWQALLHSSHAPVLAGIVKWGGLAIMGKVIVGTAAILALTLSGVQTWRTSSLSSEVGDLRAQNESTAALQQKVDALEKQLAQTKGDAAALKANLALRNEQFARIEKKLADAGYGDNTPAVIDGNFAVHRQALNADPAAMAATKWAWDARAAARTQEQLALAEHERAQAEAQRRIDELTALKYQQAVAEKEKYIAEQQKLGNNKPAAGEPPQTKPDPDKPAPEKPLQSKLDANKLDRLKVDEGKLIQSRIEAERYNAARAQQDALQNAKLNDYRRQLEVDRDALEAARQNAARQAELNTRQKALDALQQIKPVKPPAPPKDEKTEF